MCALLYTQTSHTFVDREVCKAAGSNGASKTKAFCCDGTGLNQGESESYWKSQRALINLPPAYTKYLIPLECTHIPTCEIDNKWRHFAFKAHKIFALMDCGVGLLIGYDYSREQAPREVTTGGDYEPYKKKTDLGVYHLRKPDKISVVSAILRSIKAPP